MQREEARGSKTARSLKPVRSEGASLTTVM